MGGGRLQEVSLIATEEPVGILVRWSLTRGGCSGRFHCIGKILFQVVNGQI